jgi:large subunit ribosomal protein L24
MHIRKDDIVEVITGDDKGKRGRVLRAIPKDNKVVVEGINRVYRHVRPNRRNAQGGRLSKEMPVHVSNVALIDPNTNKPTRVTLRIHDDGSKERFAKSGASLGRLTVVKKAQS